MLVFSIIGTLIGAGFASGQEMYLFFYRYGVNGILGLVLCSSLMAGVIYKTFIIIHDKQIHSYKDFLNTIFGSERLSFISNIIVNAFLLVTFYIMISGFGAYFEQRFQISSVIGASIFSFLCFFVLVKDIEGVKKVNSIIVPILIVVIFIIGILSIKRLDVTNLVNEKNSFKWILQAIVYCSYNMILVIPVLVSFGKYISSKKQIVIVSILSGAIILILAISIFSVLTSVTEDYSTIEMPAVYAIDKKLSWLSGIYSSVILFSIFSTAISIGISFLKNITKDRKSFPQFVAIMCISGALISNFGFSNLVKLLFPLFGYLGIFEMWIILKQKYNSNN